MNVLHHRAVAMGVLFVFAMTMQGCLAIVWVGAVGFDMTRTSHIEFQPFENTWMVDMPEQQHLGALRNIVVMPFPGDAAMAGRWRAILEQMTEFRVVSISDATRPTLHGGGQVRLAQGIRAEVPVDYLLFGSVVAQEPQKSFGGLKERVSLRLSVHMMNAGGILIWKTELPYTIVKGAKDLDEGMVLNALLAHVRTNLKELGLASVGSPTKQTALR